MAFTVKPGTIYQGPYAKSAPVVMNGVRDKVISGLQIEHVTGDCINLRNCSNIQIEKCKLGFAKGCGIILFNCKNIRILNCRIDSVATGVYAVNSEGISVEHITVRNVQGPMPRGQMVQFDNVRGPGNSISYNVCENMPGKSLPEDAISLYHTNGTGASPVQVKGNWIRGGGPSVSGGGIMTGDGGGSYIQVDSNILVNPGQYGIAIAGGTNITVQNNIVYAKSQSFTNVGLYVWNESSGFCGQNRVLNNEVNWRDKNGNVNTFWDGGNCGAIEGINTNRYNAAIDEKILPAGIAE